MHRHLSCMLAVWQLAQAQTVPFDFTARQIVMDGRLGGKPVRVALDTGASMSAIDSGVAKRLNIQSAGVLEVQGTDGTTGGGITVVGTLKVGEFTLPPMAVAVFDMAPLARSLGVAVDVVLGADFLQQYDTTIDYAKGVVTFVPAKDTSDGTPFELVNGMPRVRAVIDAESFDADIDTGSYGTEIPPLTASRLKLRHDGVTRVGGVAGKPGVRYAARLPAISVGKERAAGIIVTYKSSMLQEAGSEPLIGRLGNNFLSRFTVRLNYKARRVILSPRTAAVVDFDSIHPGVLVLVREGHVMVERVFTKADVGPKVGDELLKIDSTGVAGMSQAQVMRRLEGPEESTVKLTVRSHGEEKWFSMKRVNWIK